MKLLPQVKQLSSIIILTTITHVALAQTKMIVTGAKVNMSNGVYLSTNDLSATTGSLVNVNQSTIKIAGTSSGSGAIDARSGTVEQNGSAAQQLAAGSFTNKIVKTLIINNPSGTTVNDTLNITDVLAVNKGNLISEGFLTLKSSDLATARVAPIISNAATPISGNVIVERYITSKRAFRFLTAPVNATTTIRDNWMEGVNNATTSENLNPVPGYGTHISGRQGHLKGFDETFTNNPSLFIYDKNTQAWVAVPATDASMKAGQALSILIRGNRSTNLTSNTPASSPTTLRAKGQLVTGTVVVNSIGSTAAPGMPQLATTLNAYSFIANPYASPIDWLSIKPNATSISSTIYVFDPTISGSNGRGSYVAYNGSVGIQSSNNDTSKIDNNIQSGQAFFVQTTGANPSITIQETDKANLHRAVFRAPKNFPKLSLQLLIDNKEIGKRSADGLAAYFSNDFSQSLGDEDSYKFTNDDENIAILRNEKTLSIEGRKSVTANDTLPLKMWKLTSKNYAFKIDLHNFNNSVEGYLEDAYLHTATRLNNQTSTEIPFTINTDSLSAAEQRFRIVFKNNHILPTIKQAIDAYVKNNGVYIGWMTDLLNNIDSCIIERSGNAKHFLAIGVVKASGTANGRYEWFDNNPVEGKNFYRIKLVDRAGRVNYSRIGRVSLDDINGSISVAIRDNSNSFTMNFKNIQKGKYLLGLINNAGQKVYSSSIIHPGGAANYPVKLANVLASGLYHLQVSSDSKYKNIPVLIP